MRYKLNSEGIPSLKSGKRCFTKNWVAILKALATFPDGKAHSIKQMGDAVHDMNLHYKSSVLKRWRSIPSTLVKSKHCGNRTELNLTPLGFRIVAEDSFGQIL